MKHFTKALLAGVALLVATGAQAADWYPYDAAKVEPPFAADGKSVDVSYVPLEKATVPQEDDIFVAARDLAGGGGR